MASSFLNVSQNVGGSLGIALLNNFVTNSIHTHAVRLGEGFPMESQGMDIRLGLRTMLLVFRHEPGLMALPQAGLPSQPAPALPESRGPGFRKWVRFAGLILLAAIPLCLLLQTLRPPCPTGGKSGRILRRRTDGGVSSFPLRWKLRFTAPRCAPRSRAIRGIYRCYPAARR